MLLPRKRLQILSFLFLFIITIPQLGYSQNALEYRGELDHLARIFFSSGQTEDVLARLALREKSLLEMEKDYYFFVTMAEIELFRGEIKRIADLEAPAEHFSRAFDLAQQALDLEKTALAKRVPAEALSRLFSYRSAFFIIRNSSQALNLLEGALEMGEDKYMSLLLLANYYITAPKIAGGDKQKGILVFQDILSAEHPVYSFIVLNLLANDYEKENETEKAEEMLRKARDIYPESPWLGKIF